MSDGCTADSLFQTAIESLKLARSDRSETSLDVFLEQIREALEAEDEQKGREPGDTLIRPTIRFKEPARPGQVAPLPAGQGIQDMIPRQVPFGRRYAKRPSLIQIEQNIAKEALAAGNQSPSNSNTKRVGLAVIEPFIIDTRHTVGR